MHELAYSHTGHARGLLPTRWLDASAASSTSIVRAGMHRRRLRGLCVVSWTSRKKLVFGMKPWSTACLE